MVRKVSFVFFLLLFCSLFCSQLAATDYLFQVERQEVHVWIKQDGSADIWYFIDFKNSFRGRTIDIVDIGLPFRGYRLETAVASVDGFPATTIRPSEYIPVGVEIHLGSHSIPSGGNGEVSLKINQPGMVFADDIDENYASVELLTNFFGDRFTTGRTKLEVYFHFPRGVKPEEPRYHRDKFTYSGVDNDGYLYYFWLIEDSDAALAYRCGASFPKKYLDEGAIRSFTIFSRIGLFFENIFRNLWPTPLLTPIIFPWSIIIFFVVVSIVRQRKRKFKYFKPIISARGVGIKRGLTAVEAAVLMERPLNKVLSLIVFGLLKKGYIRIIQKEPFRIEDSTSEGSDLRSYERGFLKAVGKAGILEQKILKAGIIKLINSVQKKMKGYSLHQTREYYASIVETAWKHVETSDVDKSMEWILLDKDFENKFEEKLPRNKPIQRPSWWPRYYHGYGHHYYRGGGSTTSAGSGKATLSPKQFVNSVVTGFENTSHGVVTSLESFTSGVTAATNPLPQSSSGWSGGSGGGGCACACACAGCACACAGGGR